MEDNWLEKTDAYLRDEMSPDERLLFEAKLAADPELASTFNTYKNIEKTLRVREMYKTELAAIKNILNEPAVVDRPATIAVSAEHTIKPFRLKTIYKSVLLVAASVLLIVLGYFLFFNKAANTTQFASNYIKQNLTEISQEMSGTPGDLQKGITAYNLKAYDSALGLFQNVYAVDPANRDAKEYTGYVYLQKKEYEKALQQFGELEKMNGKFNKGLFLKALTYLQRNKEGDLELAKQLLLQVSATKAGGSQQAEEWLQKLKNK